MCGFLTEVTYSTDLLPKEKFIEILNLSRKRGPDSQGYLSNNSRLQIGFNRLAILDLSANGAQPKSSYTQRYMYVFNGEIYNHLQLREKLSFQKFKGNSDTETLGHCFDELGIERTIRCLNGMFAICIYDQKTKTTTLVRDFAGIKPLFYGWDGKKLVAASQYDQVRSHPHFNVKPLDLSVLKLYFEQHFIPAPFGLYQDTFQVKPGEIISFDEQGKLTAKRYWELSKSKKATYKDETKAINKIKSSLDKSVYDQTLSDVPLGAFLSGGVDSALVCSSLKKNNFNFDSFTIGSESKTHDETERANAFASNLEIQHHIWHLDAKESLSYWDEAMQSIHEPIGDFSLLPTFLVSKLAKNHVSVALSGDGGDELFFGYERFQSVAKNIKFQHYPKLAKKMIYAADRYTLNKKYVNEVLLANKQSLAHQGLHTRFRNDDILKLNADLKEINLPSNFDVFNYNNTKNKEELLANMRYAEFYGMMQKTLRKVDLASMENSLEVRVPFLDKRLINLALEIKPRLNFYKGTQKILLKKLLKQRVSGVPMETKKKGFSVPLSGWLRTSLYEKFCDTLLQDKAEDFGLDVRHIEKMLKEHRSGEADYKWPLFTLYTLLK